VRNHINQQNKTSREGTRIRRSNIGGS